MPRNRLIAAIAVVVAAFGVVAALLVKAQPNPIDDPIGFYVDALHKAIPSSSYIPVPSTGEAVYQVFEKGSHSVAFDTDQTPKDKDAAWRLTVPFQVQEALDQIRREVAWTLVERLNESTPEEYRLWRESRGYRMATEQDIDAVFHSEGTWQQMVRNVPALKAAQPANPAEGFDIYWMQSPAQAGFSRPLRISTAPNALHVVFGRTLADNPYQLYLETVQSDISWETWHGGISAGCMSWFRPPRTAAQVLADKGVVYTAALGCILDYKDSQPRPMIVRLLHDPDLNRWFIERVYMQNYHPKGELSPCIEW